MKKIGYTTGIFDLFHIGHLNVLRRARMECDYLIVGVSTDELCYTLKNKYPAIPFMERMEIVANLRCVDEVVPEVNCDKVGAWEKLKFNVIFKGDDHKGTPVWNDYETKFEKLGVEIVYFPYTTHTSSTIIRKALQGA